MKSMYWRHDWAFSGDKPKVKVEWRLLRRVFAYFLPYWPSALVILALVAASVAGGLIGVLQSYFSNRISQSIMFDLRNQLFGRMLSQSVAFFTRTRTGDVMSRLSNDVNGVQSVVSDTIFSLINNLVIIASTVFLM